MRYRCRMDNELDEVFSEINRDLSSEWIDLSTRVRNRLQAVYNKSAGTPFEGELAILAVDTSKICDHLERIHRDVEKLLVELDEKIPEIDFTPENIDPDEVRREAIQIQQETHELRADFKDVIKALFMWRDDPEERVREKH